MIILHCCFILSSDMTDDLGLEDLSFDDSNAESGQVAGATSYKPPDSARVSSLSLFRPGRRVPKSHSSCSSCCYQFTRVQKSLRLS